MFVYKRRPTLTSTDTITIFKVDDIMDDDTDTSVIDISGSTFENLNYGRVLTTFSLLNSTLPVTNLTTLEYPTFDNHGSVMNLQGYPGFVKVKESTFSNNMVYIPDIYPSKRSKSGDYEDVSYFKNSLTGQIRTTRCNDESLTKRLFSDVFTSLKE